MRYEEDAKELDCPEWMKSAISVNPGYCSWGNFEDYMWKDGDGWDSAQEIDTPQDLWELDDLNECVNFYFTVDRDQESCGACDGSGLNPKSKIISDDFYDFSGTGRKWVHDITQDEVQALQDANRLREWQDKPTPTANEVNAAYRSGMGHDGINRWILIKTRCKRLGVYGHCDSCSGEGYIYTEPAHRLALQVWMLHPRKGCSRGLYIRSVMQDDLPTVADWLKEADQRNRNRFSKLVSVPRRQEPS